MLQRSSETIKTGQLLRYLIVRFRYCMEHWPDTGEFITRSVEFWNRWIRLLCYYNWMYILCPLNTHVMPIF